MESIRIGDLDYTESISSQKNAKLINSDLEIGLPAPPYQLFEKPGNTSINSSSPQEDYSARRLLICKSEVQRFEQEPLDNLILEKTVLSKTFWQLFSVTAILQVLLICLYLIFIPQFTLQFRNDSPEARNFLSSISEGLKMVSYLAKDFSITTNDNNILTGIDYLETIDTFSDNYVYKFDPFQYCRYNTIDKTSKCIRTNGLDIFTSLATDVSLQLGNISKAENPDKLAKSLITTYSEAVSALNDMYHGEKKISFTMQNIDLATVKMAHKLKSSENYGKLIPSLMFLINITHPMLCSTLAVFCLLFFGIGKDSNIKQKQIRAYALIVFLALFLNFSVLLYNWIGDLWCYHSLNRLLSKVNVAHFCLSNGFMMITLCLSLYCLSIFLISQILLNNEK